MVANYFSLGQKVFLIMILLLWVPQLALLLVSELVLRSGSQWVQWWVRQLDMRAGARDGNVQETKRVWVSVLMAVVDFLTFGIMTA